MGDPKRLTQPTQEPSKTASKKLPEERNPVDEESRAADLSHRLASLDFSRESSVRESLREQLNAQSRRVHLWFHGFSYWATFAVVMLLFTVWFIDQKLPYTSPGAEPQATAYASTVSTSQSTTHVAATMPVMPKPIPTPLASFAADRPMQDGSPSMTVSPYNTPGITQRVGLP